MFHHPRFEKYSFERIPLNRDIYLMGEKWMKEYEESLVKFFEGGEDENVGYVVSVAARNVGASVAELSWYPNFHTRFHEVRISLPREQFVMCVGSETCDEKPRVFVKDEWLDRLYLQSYSIFALIDASGVKDALRSGSLNREKLIQLRDRIDIIAERYKGISFISFADSVLLKSNWTVGQYNSHTKHAYEPEIFVRLFPEIQSAYQQTVGLDAYAILTQGSNEYYEDPLLHISKTGNHISLNSLGLPFAQLMSIERAARAAIERGEHGRAELYMDKDFFRSLSFAFEFKKESCGRSVYLEPLMGGSSSYFFADCQRILQNLRGRAS